MKEYQEMKDGSLSLDNMIVPKDMSNKDYLKVLQEVEDGVSKILSYEDPGDPYESIKKKMEGIKFEGIMCSATSRDMWGLSSIKEWIKEGNSTLFEFENGNKLELTPDNVSAFEQVWIPFRMSFFN